MDKDKPEFDPLKEYIKSFLITVIIFDNDDKEIRREEMDYGKPEHRIWLGKISFWAWQHDYFVETSRKV